MYYVNIVLYQLYWDSSIILKPVINKTETQLESDFSFEETVQINNYR